MQRRRTVRVTEHVHPVRERSGTTRTNAVVFGLLFVLFGVLGFVPGAVSDFGALQFVGNPGGVVLLGLFEVSILHNLVHVLIGACGLVMSRRPLSAAAFLTGTGIFLVAMGVYGFWVSSPFDVNFIPLSSVDSTLHLLLGIVLLALGLYGRWHLPIGDDPALPHEASEDPRA
ncbi:DUF4383 domain-containing protein [Janibacter corallicola]|uniref:DUF4383 domain-containing protein n=1 Tax=Janibacter corallicola TaxID=415212 RepID=UPI0008320F7A|nr:DUF4383 domain-containing protein [Janibacter corallicola]